MIVPSDFHLAELRFLLPVFHHRHDALHVFGLVIGLVVDLAVRQSTVVPEGLQGARADVQHQAHVLVVHPLIHLPVALFAADVLHPADEVVELRCHRFKSFFFKNYVSHTSILVDIPFPFAK